MEEEIYKMVYQLNMNKRNYNLRILGKDFIINNKNKGKIIYKNRKITLIDIFPIKNFKENELKIKMVLDKSCVNKYSMFENCKSLLNIFLNNKGKEYSIEEDDYFTESGVDTTNTNYNNSNDTSFSDIYLSEITKREDNLIESMLDIIEKNFYPLVSKNDKNNIINISKMFSNCSSLKTLPDISNWNIENVIDISGMFLNCSKLTSLPNISKWNTKNVVDMSNLFDNCSKLKILPDISKWETNNVTNMSYMFRNCS